MSGDPGGRGARSSIGGRLAAAARDAFRPAAAAVRDAPPPTRPFDPEAEVELKREWAARHAPRASRDAADAGGGADAFGATPPGGAPHQSGAGDPSPRLFEHFAVVGLPPGVDVRAVSADIRTYQNARAAGGRAHGMTSITPGTPRDGAAAPAPGRRGAYAGLRGPACAAEVLFSFSAGGGGGAGGALPSDLADALPAFCFPHGARPELLERTPSLSALAEVVCGQPAATREDHSFVFLLKVADGARPLYGVCALAAELVHRPPALGRAAAAPPPPPLRRYLVAAPRCYCLLSHHPFFELHFRVLQALLALERLDRMAAFAAELAAPLGAPPRSPAPGPQPSAFAPAAAEAAAPAAPAAGGAGPAAAASRELSLEPGATTVAPRGGEGEGGGPASSYASTEASSSGSSAAELATPTGGDGALGAASGDLDLNLDELALGARPRRPPAGGALAPGALPYCEEEDEEGGGGGAAAGDTPNAPLLPATPFFTPAGNGGAGGGASPASSGRARRAARRHGAAESPAAPAALGLGGAALRAAAAGATLGDALAGAAARLAPSPPGAGGDAEGDDWHWADAGGGGAAAAAPAADAALAEARAAAPSGAAVLAAYAAARVPAPGETLVFAPSPALQPIRFARPAAHAAPRAGPGSRPGSPGARGAALAGAPPDLDAAAALEPWAVAAACRALSLDSLLTFITAALLERQVRVGGVCVYHLVSRISTFFPPFLPTISTTHPHPTRQIVVFCPNPGLLAAVVLSLLPLLLPFAWQSVLLPVLPAAPGRLDLLDAPVPFVAGVVFKTPEVAARCAGLVRVNVYKDRVRGGGALPPLPGRAALAGALAAPHAALARAGGARAPGPAHAASPAEAAAAAALCAALRRHLAAIVRDLPGYSITDVSRGGGEARVSVLLTEPFVESHPPRDRPFVRAFAETQMFASYCDAAL
jgi:hypothetical protein